MAMEAEMGFCSHGHGRREARNGPGGMGQVAAEFQGPALRRPGFRTLAFRRGSASAASATGVCRPVAAAPREHGGIQARPGLEGQGQSWRR